jgi:hypothetical protein
MELRATLLLSVLVIFSFPPGAGLAAVIPLFDARFTPPLNEISGLNPDSCFLAVQTMPGSTSPARVISIDKRGRVTTIEELAETQEITVPGERLWIAGEGPRPDADANAVPPQNRRLPVVSARVYLSAGGGSYTTVFETRGGYYELRHKDSRGGLLFIAVPRDPYGLKKVIVSADGGRVIVVDESSPGSREAGGIGQRYYVYDSDGRLLSDVDFGDDTDNWLDFSGGIMAADGSCFLTGRGGGKTLKNLVLLDAEGQPKWEKAFFEGHQLSAEMGGLFLVKGGNRSFMNFIDSEGSVKMLERMGYAFDLWLSKDGSCAYILMLKEFDFKKSGIAGRLGELFPGIKVVFVNLEKFRREGHGLPSIEVSPDGKAFILTGIGGADTQAKTGIALYDQSMNELWKDAFFGANIVPRFTGGGFLLRFGSPASRLSYYEAK